MSLLQHNDNEKRKKNLLTRGPKIEVSSTVKRSDIQPSSEDPQIKSRITEAVNIRVDNHIRNKIAALITLGHGDSQKDVADNIVNYYLETLDSDELKRFEDLIEIYEEKDYARYQKKKNKAK
ncbi:DUF5388 domain-containing protein [Listeria innocua]|uniref:DUF5388 domain-containing protein n=1 Tax=Listeria innocua TaxID=1642 RepID=UPI0016289616|nr:DUF5388 domain-containing protein [Listeria innocua]MBC2137505.1 DUF5388 domain-containing protein [Listeria innocua]